MAEENEFWPHLLCWYEAEGRDFPWRRTSNPFHILIAEFLLQQTHVRKVEDVYHKLLKRYPTPQAMAEADIQELEQIILPIGLVYRAVRLKKAAEIICSRFDGRVPDKEADLKELPGVGDYIANAVLCYAYGQPAVPIDTNVIRLFARYFGHQSSRSRPRTDRELAARIRSHYEQFEDTRTPNLAVLDFAALVCTARNPQHHSCPLRLKCSYYNMI